MDVSIFENAVIHQPGESAPVEALLVEGETIVLAGTVAECRRAANGPNRRVDLAGAHVVPGFNDCHVHSAQMAMQAIELNVSSARSCDAVVRLVDAALHDSSRARPAGLTATGWLVGGGWSRHEWSDPRAPDRAALDSVSAGTPVALHSVDLHSYWLNSSALARLGIDRHTPDPPGGGIERLGREPTGIVSEAAAFDVQSQLEDDSRCTLDGGILAALERFLAVGVTGIHDLDGAAARACLSTLASESRLPVRVHKLTPVWDLEDVIDRRISSGCGDDWFNNGGVKIFADGSLSSHTCLLHTDFLDQPGNTGIAVTAPDELASLVRRCNDHDLSVAIHAIGDAAVTHALDALAGGSSHRLVPHRIEHFQHARPSDVRRAAAIGVVACMQPASCTSDMEMVEQSLGARELISYGWQSLLTAGIKVAFSSDAPVEDINPFTGIHAATTRQRPDGTPAEGWQPGERLSREEAFACYQTGPAVASGRSDRHGSLTVGRLADFAVLDRDPFAVDARALLETAVTMTVVGGQIRFSQ